jgi:uncharacterized protein YdiU (UPF0061 family)
MKLRFDPLFSKELSADPIDGNQRRQVSDASFSWVTPRVPSKPKLVHASKEVAQLLGLKEEDLESEEFLAVFSGTRLAEGSKPYAMAYGGHQFGTWAGQLGDGRAINLGEVEAKNQHWALQLKGSGETPYSRNADGFAVLRSSIREHLCSEAMFALGVPTTRSLSLMLTGDEVLRDVLYNGNSAMEPGAVVCRVSESFVRFGNFQLLAARNSIEELEKLTKHVIHHFYPDCQNEKFEDSVVAFFEAVCDRTIELIVEWQRVGFVHGVMNTDNMSILGQTIDYGPYGWVDDYDQNWTPNTTDRSQKRYRFGNQAYIANWNLLQLANALYPLVKKAQPFEDALKSFRPKHHRTYLNMMRSKLGLKSEKDEDEDLILRLEHCFSLSACDMSIFFRELCSLDWSEKALLPQVKIAFYDWEEIQGEVEEEWSTWFAEYLNRWSEEETESHVRQAGMKKINPKYVLRNYMAQIAIEAAEKGNFGLIHELYMLLQAPYEEQDSMEKWYAKRPDWAKNKVGASMLSCSS